MPNPLDSLKKADRERLFEVDPSTLDAEALEELNTELSNLRDAALVRQQTLVHFLNESAVQREARLKYEAMTDAERAALVQMVRASAG